MAFIGEPVEVLLGAAVTAVQRNAGAQLNGVTDAILRYGCSVAGAAAAGAGTAAASGAQAPSTPAGPGPDCPTARGRGPAHKWKPHEIEALVSVLRAADPRKRLPVRKGLEALGWASVPDPDGVIYDRVNFKLKLMRWRVRHGEEPVPAEGTRRAVDKALKWTAWIQAAAAQYAGRLFTFVDIMAMLEANPGISPLLDRRPDPNRKSTPRWQRQFHGRFTRVPGVVMTGQKRGKYNLYRYDPTDPMAVKIKSRRQRKKGVPGLPYLGRHEGSKGHTMAAAGQQQQPHRQRGG